MKKNTFKNNMRRFKTKNLNEQTYRTTLMPGMNDEEYEEHMTAGTYYGASHPEIGRAIDHMERAIYYATKFTKKYPYGMIDKSDESGDAPQQVEKAKKDLDELTIALRGLWMNPDS